MAPKVYVVYNRLKSSFIFFHTRILRLCFAFKMRNWAMLGLSKQHDTLAHLQVEYD